MVTANGPNGWLGRLRRAQQDTPVSIEPQDRVLEGWHDGGGLSYIGKGNSAS
jgi:hypothetical protein